MRGRPTLAAGTTEAKLQQRKLDALKRGVHRVVDAESLPFGVHIIGIGGAGAGVVERVLHDAPADLLANAGSRLSALAIDIGGDSGAAMNAIHAHAAKFDSSRTHIDTIALDIAQADALSTGLESYRRFLDLEYPMRQSDAPFRSWLAAASALPAANEPLPRAVAKAIYGLAFYDGERPLAAALKRFATSTTATAGDAVVCIVFGLGGGTGSGIAVDLARHLSTGIFGRRVLVMGIGIAPCAGDVAAHRGAQLFTVFNELDALCDEAQNRGVVQACGDMYKNPFTAGFLVAPQQAFFAQTGDLAATHSAIDHAIAQLLTHRHGANLWEVLRLLNWVAAPSTQHSAARTPWGAKWMHMLGASELAHEPGDTAKLLRQGFGLLPSYAPEFIEMRVAGDAPQASLWAGALDAVFAPEVPTQVATGGPTGTLQFVLPRVAKSELADFFSSRAAYDQLPPDARVMVHSLLLERGVVLCEPSVRIAGMAGASLPGSDGWVGVPLDAMRGPPAPADQPATSATTVPAVTPAATPATTQLTTPPPEKTYAT